MLDAAAGHPFPLLPGSGVLLICSGAAVLAGALARRWFAPIYLAGIFAGLAVVHLAGLSVPRETIPPEHMRAFSAALLAELVVVPVAWWRLGGKERRLILVVLLIGALHFGLMAPSHGPLVAVLGLALLINAAVALRQRSWRLGITLGLDGGLRIATGVVLLVLAPRLGW